MRLSILLLLAMSLTAAAACSKPFEAKTPNGFIELKDQEDAGYAYRAAHPDGLVVSVRVLRNKPPGSEEFWSRAIENQLRQVKGYRLLTKSPCKNGQALPGTLMKFGHDEGKSPHLYWVAVFLKEADLFVLELGGTQALMTAQEAELLRFVEGFIIK